MKLNQIPNLRVEDFPNQQDWIGKMFIQLNPFIQAVNQVLDKSVDFTANIKTVTKDYDITSFQAFNFTWTYPESPPNDLRVTKALKGSTLIPTILLPAWQYDASTQIITVSRIVEVNDVSVSTLSGRYQFTVRASV